MARKSAEAFRTISEVSELIDTPAHVLRFWESKFTQVRPVKRAGGRRYYRPDDVALLDGIRKLLHDDGVTIRGVQKILKEQGPRQVVALSPLSGGAAPEAAEKPRDTAPAPAMQAPRDAAPAATPPAAAPPAATPPAATPPAEAPRRPAIIRSRRDDDAPELPFDTAPPAPDPLIPMKPAGPPAATEALPLSVRLRRAPAGHLTGRTAALAPLQARLATLHARMLAAQSQTRD